MLRERRCRRKNDILLNFGVDVAATDSCRIRHDADDAIDADENDDATDSAQSSSFVPSNVVDDFDLDTLFRNADTARPSILPFVSWTAWRRSHSPAILLLLITKIPIDDFAKFV